MKNLALLCLNITPRKGGTHAQKTSETLRNLAPSETKVEAFTLNLPSETHTEQFHSFYQDGESR